LPIIFFALLFIGSIVPGVGNYHVLTVLSGSMEPAIKTGSVVVVSPAEEYEPGHVVTFKTGSESEIPTTHRIKDVEIDRGNTVYVTKGDANPGADLSRISKEDIIGKARFSIPYMGYIVEFIRTPIGFIIVIGLPAIVIITEEVKKIKEEVKKKKSKKDGQIQS